MRHKHYTTHKATPPGQGRRRGAERGQPNQLSKGIKYPAATQLTRLAGRRQV
jgi:hypothetical protein